MFFFQICPKFQVTSPKNNKQAKSGKVSDSVGQQKSEIMSQIICNDRNVQHQTSQCQGNSTNPNLRPNFGAKDRNKFCCR